MGKIIRAAVQPLSLIDKKLANIASAAALVVAGAITGNYQLVAAGLSLGSSALAKKSPQVPPSNRDRLFASLDPSTPRKFAFGSTALATDVRYQEFGGDDQEYRDDIIVVASHKVGAIREIWIEDKLAWSIGGGVTSTYTGYLTVDVRLEGSAANTISINGGAKWGPSRRLTGCAYVRLRYKTTGNSKKAESPFAGGIPQRMTIVGDGAYVYDPRFDSTAGGSGLCRANDQSTWIWTESAGNNPALMLLTYMLGWKIEGKLAVGIGLPPRRIDMASFIAAANLCDEPVTLAAGGTEPRYRAAGIFSEADAPTGVFETILAACAGTLRDSSGKLALTVLHNDLAVPAPALTDDHVLDSFTWAPDQSIDEGFNVVRGRRTDPSANALYQLVDYPQVSLTSPDGLDRVHPFDLALVQSVTQAQRLAKQELQRAQYPGVFTADFTYAALRCQVGAVVPLTFSALGFASKLFRVVEQTIRLDGTVAMAMREENAAIYAWTAEETAAVTPIAPTVYDPANSPLVQAIGDVADASIETNRDAEPPETMAIGSLYIDPDNVQFRFEGPVLTYGGEPITFGGETITATPYVEILPGPVRNATYQIDIVPPATQTIFTDYLGANLPNQFPPRVLTPTVKRGGEDIRTSLDVTYSITTSGVTATVNNTPGSADKGRITVTAGGIGNILLTVTINGTDYGPYKTQFVKEQAAAPQSGGVGANGGFDATFPTINSTSYVVVAGPITCTIASGQTLNCAFPAKYALTATVNASAAVQGKWQRSPHSAGTWTDLPAGAITGGNAVWNAGDYSGETSEGIFNDTASGLAAGDYDIQFVARLTVAGGGRAMEIFDSTATVLVS